MKRWWNESSRARLRFYAEFLGSLIFLLICFNVHDTFHSMYFHTFMRRDLGRALELLQGHFIFFGPEASGGGFLPGPLFYYLLAPALMVMPGWQGAFWLLIGVYLTSTMLAWIWLRERFGIVAAVLFLAIVAYSHPVRSFVLLFLNVSYLIPFALFALLFACAAYSEADPKRRERQFLYAVILCALGMQIHFSILCVMWGMFFLQIFAPRLGLLRPRWRSWGWAAGIFAVSVLPYAVWYLAQRWGWNFGQQGSFIGEAPGAGRTLFMLAGYSSQVPFEVAAREAGLRILAVTPFVLFVAVLAWGSAHLWARIRQQALEPIQKSPFGGRDFRALLWMSAWAFIPFSYVFLVHMGRRYGMVFCYASILITVLLVVHVFERRSSAWFMAIYSLLAAAILAGFFFHATSAPDQLQFSYLLIALAPLVVLYFPVRRRCTHPLPVLIATSAAIFLMIQQYNMITPRGLREKIVPRFHLSDYQKLWNFVYSDTGWDFDTAMRHIYFVNLRLDEDPRPVYEDVMQKNWEVTPSRHAADGYFVLNAKFLNSRNEPFDYRDFLLKQRIPPEIRAALEKGEIKFKRPHFHGAVLLPFRLSATANLPRQFHDLGEGYVRSAASRKLDLMTELEGAKTLADGTHMFKWNACPGHHPFCSTGAIVALNAGARGHYRLNVEVVGSAISQNSPWISPSWTEAWVRPYVEVKCGTQNKRFNLFSSIGLMREYGSNEYNELLQANNSVVAPLRREFEFDCPSTPTELAVGREATVVEKLMESVNLPGQRLNLSLGSP